MYSWVWLFLLLPDLHVVNFVDVVIPVWIVVVCPYALQSHVEVKKNIRNFCGWTFSTEDAEYKRKRTILVK